MPYQDSPGWERQWKNFSWDWDFHVSTVSEGHRVVNDKDKSDAKTKGAKLTFGEVLDCGVSRMLHNLGAAHKTSFHDLGMGPGKMLIQTYLQYKNLRTCMGVELAKGRYDLGERNIRTLLKNGWRGRKFLGIEFKIGHYFKIVEDVPDKAPKEGWKVGDKVVAYYPGLKTDKMIHKDYHGVITDIKKHESGDDKKTLYAVKYDDNSTCDRVQRRYLFIPGKERTCEVWYGSLFDYPGGFDAEICVLETDFPEEMHPHLIECMTTTPIGCTFLTYHDLKKFKCYDWDNLRQIDCNIYDNDRYITSWSQGWRFYLWEHVKNFRTEKPYDIITDKLYDILRKDDQIVFQDKRESDSPLQYGEILTINKDDEKSDEINLIVRTNKIEVKKVQYQNLTLSSSDYKIYKTRHRFRIGQEVSAYYVENLKDTQYQSRFEIFRAKVIAINANKLSYVIKYLEENTTRLDVSEKYVYKLPALLYKKGESVMACWPRNAQNKNCPHRYKRFPAEIMDINNDSTYRLRYQVSPFLLSLLRPQVFPDDYVQKEDNKKQSAYAPTADNCFAENVREMWIQYPADFVVKDIQQVQNKIGLPFYTKYTAEYCQSWENKECIQWINDIGLGTKLAKLFQLNNIDGKALLDLKFENEKELNVAINKLLSVVDGDNKTESTEINNNDNDDQDGVEDKVGLNRIELKNLFANIKHLRSQNEMMQQQFMNQAGGHQDYQKLQQVWRDFRKDMGRQSRGAGNAAAANYEDTDTK